MPSRTIRTERQREAYIATLRALKLPFTAQHSQGVNRSLEQNRLQFAWAREFAEAMGDRTAEEVQREWKLIYGVPILRAHDDVFRDVYDQTIKPLPYEKKIEVMRYLPVTSHMTVDRMQEYLDTVQREAAKQGVDLKDPDASWAEP